VHKTDRNYYGEARAGHVFEIGAFRDAMLSPFQNRRALARRCCTHRRNLRIEWICAAQNIARFGDESRAYAYFAREPPRLHRQMIGAALVSAIVAPPSRLEPMAAPDY